MFRPCLAPCDRCTVVPEGTTVLGRGGSGGSPEGVASAASPTGHEGDASGSAPRGGPPRRPVHPKASGFRRHRDASPKRLVRDPALAPKSGGRWFELLPSVLPRLPAYMMERPLAADTHARRREHLRATRAHPRRMLRRTPLPSPEGLERRASRRRHPEVGPWRLVTPAISSKLERRLRARQSSCSPGRPRLDPKTKSLPRSEDRIDRRRSAVGAVGPHIPPVVAIRREHRSARAEMDRDPSQAAPTGVGAASVPESPKRSRNPDRCDPDGQ